LTISKLSEKISFIQEVPFPGYHLAPALQHGNARHIDEPFSALSR
tara:strand:- start:418 stop:552 length:135 start_codon:yes stop_codon:yes gene_type:complete